MDQRGEQDASRHTVSTPNADQLVDQRGESDAPRRAPGTPSADQLVLRIIGVLIVLAAIRKGAFYSPYDLALPVAALALAFAATVRRDVLQRSDWITIASLLAFAVWWSVDGTQRGDWGQSRQVVGSAIGFAACLAIGRTLDAASRRALQVGAVLFGAAMAAIGLVGVALRIDPLALPAQGHLRLAGTLTYSNAMGALLAMLLVAAVAAAVSRWRDAVLVLITGGVVATQSRGAVLAVLLALVLVRRHVAGAALPLGLGVLLGAVTVAGSGDGNDHVEVLVLAAALPLLVAALPQHRLTPRRLLVALTVFVLVFIGLALPSDDFRDAAQSRLSSASVDDRSAEWRAGWREFTDSPLTGAGPGAQLQLADDRDARFVHNEPLQIAADSGLIGLALVVLAFAAPLIARREGPRVEAAPAVLTVFVVCGLLDFPWHLPAITMTAALLLTGLPKSHDP
jgi:O-antigen ligase